MHMYTLCGQALQIFMPIHRKVLCVHVHVNVQKPIQNPGVIHSTSAQVWLSDQFAEGVKTTYVHMYMYTTCRSQQEPGTCVCLGIFLSSPESIILFLPHRKPLRRRSFQCRALF